MAVTSLAADRLRLRAGDDRLRSIVDLHFHPRHGSLYWLRRAERLDFDPRDRVRRTADLWLLGPTPLEDLSRFAVRDFIPQTFHERLQDFVVGETAGTSGRPRATAYRDDEFQRAFVTPFLRVAEATGFPCNSSWLWVGPSGPHIIGKVVRELARQTGGMDPFSVDFDPRWAKRLTEGSLARQRYLNHVTDQALEVINREEIGVLFITPPALTALAERMSDRQREAIRGVHYGGLSISPETLNAFRVRFPHAVHLAGYGNTLFGVAMEPDDVVREHLDYFLLDDRVRLDVVRWVDDGDSAWPPEPVAAGERGQVAFHRLDESCLLAGVLERDEAEAAPPSSEAVALGACGVGLRDPRPPAALEGRLRIGLY